MLSADKVGLCVMGADNDGSCVAGLKQNTENTEKFQQVYYAYY